MVYHYYPGCTLKTKAKDLDRYGRKSMEALGITLSELENWQCCGGAFTMAKDEIATKLSSVRALSDSRDGVLVTLCSACHNVIKQTNYAMANDAEFAQKVNNYSKFDLPYNGETKVMHYLEVLRDEVGFDNLKKAVKNPLTGKKIAAYYGCLLLRPSKALQMDNPVLYPYRNECCGGYMATEDKASASKKSGQVMDSAAEMGADMIITACPLCLYNLNKNAPGHQLPVYYFTELLAEALGVKD